MMFSITRNDGNLDYQINMLFNKHDFNRSGYLGIQELQSFLNELLPAMGYSYFINFNQAREILFEIDRNCDGRASRREVKLMFNHIINNAARYGFGPQVSMGMSNGFGINTGFGGGGLSYSVNLGGSGFGGGFGGGYNNNFGNNMMGSSFSYSGPGYNSGFNNVATFSYNGVWNNYHDQFLRNEIDRVYMLYDFNRSGQLQGPEFCNAYRDLCISTGQVPPNDYFTIRQIAMQADTNFDGKISKMQMFNLFKRCQFNLF